MRLNYSYQNDKKIIILIKYFYYDLYQFINRSDQLYAVVNINSKIIICDRPNAIYEYILRSVIINDVVCRYCVFLY